MGQAEWMLVVTIGSLVGVGGMGLNLVAALWNGRPPRPVPLTTWLGVMILAASVLLTQWDEDETNTIVAAVATAEPICTVAATPVQVVTLPRGALLDGDWAGSGCHLWALIQDPRTGTFWVQGPASVDSWRWTLSIALATTDVTGGQPYLVSIAAVDDGTHDGWLAQALATDGIVSTDSPAAFAWPARAVALDAATER